MMHYMSVILCKCTMCCFHNLETPNSRTPGFDGCIESRIGTVYMCTTAKLQLLEKVFLLRPFLCHYWKPLNSHAGLIRDDLAARELSWSMSIWRSAASWEPKLILNCYTDGYKTWRRARWHRHRRCDLCATRSTFFPVFFYTRSHFLILVSVFSCLALYFPMLILPLFSLSFFLLCPHFISVLLSHFRFFILTSHFFPLVHSLSYLFTFLSFFLSFCFLLLSSSLVSFLLASAFFFFLTWGGWDDKYLVICSIFTYH